MINALRRKSSQVPRFSQISPLGSQPGLLAKRSQLDNIQCLVYDSTTCQTISFANLKELKKSLENGKVHWLSYFGEIDAAQISALSFLDFDHLALEDIINSQHRSKYEQFNEFDYWVFRVPDQPHSSHQANLLIKNNLIVSIFNGSDRVSPLIRARIQEGRGNIRHLPGAYLAYALVDVVIDMYFKPIENIADRLDSFETTIISQQTLDVLGEIHSTKNDLLLLRKLVTAHRDAIAKIMNTTSPHFPLELNPYIRDVHDHTIQQLESIDTYRVMGSNLMDLALSLADHNANETMKFLTVVASIFIPLTFIAGVYGMNFNPQSSPLNMPELQWYFGYPAAMLLMLAVAVGLLIYFKRKRWI